MKFSEALAAIKALDNGSELVSAIDAEVESLKSKNYEVIGEKRTATGKVTAYEAALTAIAKALGIEGDLESILSDTEGKVKAITTEVSQLKTDKTALETRATEAEGKLQGFERKTRLTEIATAAGANAAVLERLLGDKFDQLTVEGEGDKRVVKLGDKPLKEAIAADEGLKLFEAALFPAQSSEQSQPKSSPKLPGGSPDGTSPEKPSDPVAAYTSQAYGGFKAFAKA